ncbi:Protein GRD-15, partial [Aphelenchoides avenae]
KSAEQRFQTKFETVAGIKDFVSKQHFYQNNICKIEREGRYILAFATPKQDVETPTSSVEPSGYVH